MKLTAKRLAAQDAAQKELKRKYVSSIPNEQLYGLLTDAGFIWDAKAVQWVRGSTSMFADEFGLPSGVVRFRIMAHPADVDKMVAQVKTHFDVIETSEPYPNRKGKGVRVYCTVKL